MITMTENAVVKAKAALEKRGKGIGIRVGTKRTGCSGLAYTLEFIDEQPEAFFFEFDNNGVKVFVDPKDYAYLSGMQLDYVKKGLNEGFDFVNPNEKARCGCGESFTV